MTIDPPFEVKCCYNSVSPVEQQLVRYDKEYENERTNRAGIHIR